MLTKMSCLCSFASARGSNKNHPYGHSRVLLYAQGCKTQQANGIEKRLCIRRIVAVRALYLLALGLLGDSRYNSEVGSVSTMASRQRIIEIEDFWTRHFALYLYEHQHPLSRLLHMFGIPILLFTALLALITHSWGLFLIGQIVGWTIQILGHKIEGNRPAFLRDPTSFVMGPVMVLVELAEMGGIHFEFAQRARRAVER